MIGVNQGHRDALDDLLLVQRQRSNAGWIDPHVLDQQVAGDLAAVDHAC